MNQDQPISNVQENLGAVDNNVTNTEEQQDIFDDPDNNTWSPTGDMVSLPTGIFKNNSLNQTTRKTILQSEPRNRDISFEPPIMDRKIWTNMPRQAKDHDKDLRRLAYRYSSVVRPIDNALRSVYSSKPTESSGEIYEAWVHIEQTILNARALVLDALTFTNEIRQEQALKSTISFSYCKPPDRDEVFGDELYETIKKENEANKLLNDAAFQRRKHYSQGSYNRNQSTSNSQVNFKKPTGSSGYKGKNKGNSWRNNSWKGQGQNYGSLENNNQGGQSTRQS